MKVKSLKKINTSNYKDNFENLNKIDQFIAIFAQNIRISNQCYNVF